MSRYAAVELLTPHHDTTEFDCGSSAQTTWLRKHALGAQQTGTSRVYAVCRRGEKRVVGYHALASASIRHEDASAGVRAGLPRYPIPATLLTRLGVDRTERGQGLGRALVVDAIRRVIAAAGTIGVTAVLIHAESAAARDFYLHLAEFEESPSDPLHLMLRLEALRATLASD